MRELKERGEGPPATSGAKVKRGNQKYEGLREGRALQQKGQLGRGWEEGDQLTGSGGGTVKLVVEAPASVSEEERDPARVS